MPTNKHAAFRYRVINQCLTNRGRRKWTLNDLVQEVSRCLYEEFGTEASISKRSIQGDINVMRSPRPRGFSAPIVCRQGLYFYSDPNFSIDKSPLGQHELKLLRETVGLLAQFPGMPQLPALKALLTRIDGKNHLADFSTSYIQFETNPAVQGLEWLGALYRAIVDQKVLSIRYHPFTDPPLNILLHPYLLKEWRNRWYIFGRNSAGQLWNLALDRIRGIHSEPATAYLPNNLFDPATWFADMVGVTKPDGAEPVAVRFATTYLNARYLETRPIHPSQRLMDQDGDRYEFSLRVIINPELVNELVRFGRELEVLAPENLKEMVAVRLG
ncbi:MAG: WYL domain-containing protein [Saprospiraceae bacterium]